MVQHIPDTLYYRVKKPENSTPCAKPDFGVKMRILKKSLKTGNCRLHVYLNNVWNGNGKTFSDIKVKHNLNVKNTGFFHISGLF